jgi:hypothetical protein
MHIVKSFGVMSVAKIMGVLYACMGLLFALFFLLFGLLGSMAEQQNSPFAGIVGVVVAIFLPFFYTAHLDLLAARSGRCCTTFFRSGWVGSKSRWSCGQQLRLCLTRLSLPPLPASD